MRDANLCLKASGAETSSVTNATGIDFGGPDVQTLTYVLHCTGITGAEGTLNVKIQESDNNSDWRDVLLFED